MIPSPEGTPPEQQIQTWQLQGLWKIHAMLLTTLLTIMILLSCTSTLPTSTATAHSTVSAIYDAKDGSVTNGTVISQQCLAALLVIGSVEQNPGPLKEGDAEKENILASLVINTDDDAIKSVLRIYDVGMTTKDLKKKLSVPEKEKLVKTMDFLGVPDQESYTKPAVVHKLICRIQNLFPDKCAICNTLYAIQLGETPLLECASCGQGAHTDCITKCLGITTEELLTFTTEKAKRWWIHITSLVYITSVVNVQRTLSPLGTPEGWNGPEHIRPRSMSQLKKSLFLTMCSRRITHSARTFKTRVPTVRKSLPLRSIATRHLQLRTFPIMTHIIRSQKINTLPIRPHYIGPLPGKTLPVSTNLTRSLPVRSHPIMTLPIKSLRIMIDRSANFTGRAPVDMASVERNAPTDIHRLAKPWYGTETMGPVAAQMATNARHSTQRCVSSHSRPVSVSLLIVPQGMLLEPKGPPLNAQTSLVKWTETADVTSSWLIF